MRPLLLLASGIISAVIVSAQPAIAEPSKAQVTALWEQQHNVKGRVLELKSRGGQRPTNELYGKKYLTPVGTCWDYDVVELQKCGCRLFEKASVCCRHGSTKECEVRIGTTTKMLDCAKYGKPKYGMSGTVEPEECKVRKQAAACWSRQDLLFGPGVAIGPCMENGPVFTCPKGQDTVTAFLERQCGPTPEDCGCTLVEECSKPQGLACYKQWKSDKQAVDCFWNEQHDNNYKRWKCYDDLKKSRQ